MSQQKDGTSDPTPNFRMQAPGWPGGGMPTQGPRGLLTNPMQQRIPGQPGQGMDPRGGMVGSPNPYVGSWGGGNLPNGPFGNNNSGFGGGMQNNHIQGILQSLFGQGGGGGPMNNQGGGMSSWM